MKIIETTAALQSLRKEISTSAQPSVGFVPTMGALHDGHYSLTERARKENEIVIASVFVNPAQFNDPTDLDKYPRPIEKDLAGLAKAGVDFVFLPKPADIYTDGYRFEVREKEFSQVLCGAHRPGHFEGVLTVVLKLFNLVKPSKAYFGEKDYQQLKLIQDMAQTFFLDTAVIACPTLREADGLAMSSRNLRLTETDRERAPLLYRALKNAPSAEAARRELEQAGFKVDYVEEHWGRRFGAAFLGEVRLIDNVER